MRIASVLALGVAAAALTIQGCTSGPATSATGSQAATSSAASADAARPALTIADARAPYLNYLAVSDEAARTGDGSLILPLVTGMAADLARTDYALAREAGVKVASARYAYGTPTFYLPEPPPARDPQYFVVSVERRPVAGAAAAAGPDVAAGVGLPPAGRVLMLFQRPSSGGPWQVASVSQLAPGQSVPRLATDSHGYVIPANFSSADGTELVRPALAPPLQASVVDDGPSSSASEVVAGGPLTTGMYEAARTSMRGLAAPSGDVYQWLLEGSSYARVALRAADGGALVLYAMYLNTTVETPSALRQEEPIRPGPPISVPAYVRPLLHPGKTAPRTRLEAQDILTFAAIDPPASATNAKITVIAIGGGLYQADAS